MTRHQKGFFSGAAPVREWVPECFDEAEPVTLNPAPNSPRDGKSYPYEDVFVLLFLGALCTASYYFACWVVKALQVM